MCTNVESAELPAYLQVGKGKYYMNIAPQPRVVRQGKKMIPNQIYGVSADAPSFFMGDNSLINYSKEK